MPIIWERPLIKVWCECFDAASGMVHFPTEEAFGSVVAEGFARNLKLFGARTGGIVKLRMGCRAWNFSGVMTGRD